MNHGVDQLWDAASLPEDDNVNPYAYSVDVGRKQWFIQKGRMIAYTGQMRFESVTGGLSHLLGVVISSPLYAGDWVGVQGQGKLLLGHHGFDVNGYDLEDANMTIRAGNLLAFGGQLVLKESIVPGFVTVLGSGKIIAASNGEVQFVDPPVRVDPQALVGWADCPSPSHHYDQAYLQGGSGILRGLTGLGGVSGEEHQFDFTGQGTVLIQSSEATMSSGALVRQIEGQTSALGLPDLQGLTQRLQARLAQQQQH